MVIPGSVSLAVDSTMSYAVRIPRAIATDESVNGWLQMIAGLVTLDALERHD